MNGGIVKNIQKCYFIVQENDCYFARNGGHMKKDNNRLKKIVVTGVCIMGVSVTSTLRTSASCIEKYSVKPNKQANVVTEWYGDVDESDENKHEFKVTPEKKPDKWKKLNTHEEKINVCQIAKVELQKMSTTELLSACLEYPMFGDMAFFDNDQEGFTEVKENYNALGELLKRKDAGKIVYDRYRELNFDELIELSEYPLLQLRYFETILVQKRILSTMSVEERADLLELSKKNIELKITKYEGKLDPIPSIWIIVRILNMDNSDFRKLVDENKSLNYFEKYGTLENVTEKELDEVIEYINTIMG